MAGLLTGGPVARRGVAPSELLALGTWTLRTAGRLIEGTAAPCELLVGVAANGLLTVTGEPPEFTGLCTPVAGCLMGTEAGLASAAGALLPGLRTTVFGWMWCGRGAAVDDLGVFCWAGGDTGLRGDGGLQSAQLANETAYEGQR